MKAEQTTSEIMAEVIRQAGIPEATPYFGTDLDKQDVDNLKAGQYKVFVQAREDTGDNLAASTYGEVLSGDILVSVFCKGKNGGKLAVQKARQIVAAGYTNEDGNFGTPAVGPYTIGGKKFFRWWPLGRVFTEDAENVGSVWLKEQIIEFSMIKNNKE